MRRRMRVDDYVFGVSPSGSSRRILYCGQIEECLTYRDAHHRFPELRGPKGPIHVCPIKGTDPFPESDYEHIAGSMHQDKWKADLATRELDRFFVFRKCDGWLGRWLGSNGPEVDEEILVVLNTCCVVGAGGKLGMNAGTLNNPIAHGA